jgi:hypothetical protein
LGYFDIALAEMGNKVDRSKLPDFNQEFGKKTQNKPVMLGINNETNRGALAFKFLGPLDRQIADLGKFFKKSGATRGGGDGVLDSL